MEWLCFQAPLVARREANGVLEFSPTTVETKPSRKLWRDAYRVKAAIITGKVRTVAMNRIALIGSYVLHINVTEMQSARSKCRTCARRFKFNTTRDGSARHRLPNRIPNLRTLPASHRSLQHRQVWIMYVPRFSNDSPRNH